MIPSHSPAATQAQLLGLADLGSISGGTLPMLNERGRRQFESTRADNPVSSAARRGLINLHYLVELSDPSRGWNLPPF